MLFVNALNIFSCDKIKTKSKSNILRDAEEKQECEFVHLAPQFKMSIKQVLESQVTTTSPLCTKQAKNNYSLQFTMLSRCHPNKTAVRQMEYSPTTERDLEKKKKNHGKGIEKSWIF